MSKRIILQVSSIITLGLFMIGVLGTYSICNGGENCVNILHSFFIHFLPIIPLFLLSLITYKMREEVYRAWLRFAYIWIPLSMLLIFLAPEYSADWMLPIVKGTVAFFSSVLFAVISLLIISWKYFVSRRKV